MSPKMRKMTFFRVFISSIIISLTILSIFSDLKFKSNDHVFTQKNYSYRNLSNRLMSGNLTGTQTITEFQINHGSYGTLDWIWNFINLTLTYTLRKIKRIRPFLTLQTLPDTNLINQCFFSVFPVSTLLPVQIQP